MESMPKVRADRDKLYEVLANLLENAIKFTPSGGRVQIGAQVLDDRHVKVRVSDTGCGISEEHLPKIFDKFYRVQSGSGHAAGAGLGLAIAKGLIELHGGTIAVESAPGKRESFLLHSALHHLAEKKVKDYRSGVFFDWPVSRRAAAFLLTYSTDIRP